MPPPSRGTAAVAHFFARVDVTPPADDRHAVDGAKPTVRTRLGRSSDA
jgi:hypothetical protein